MTITATEAKAKLLSLLDQVEAGEDIEITRHGRPIARLIRAKRSPKELMGTHAGIAWSTVPEELLFTTGERWNAED